MSETERSGVERMAKQGDDVERSETESPCALALASNTIIYTTVLFYIFRHYATFGTGDQKKQKKLKNWEKKEFVFNFFLTRVL